jgi:hypothetical protein
MTKEEIRFKHNIYVGQYSTYTGQDVEAAMDEYAKAQFESCIKWAAINGWRNIGGMWWQSFKELKPVITTSELYTLFLAHQSLTSKEK